jgi:outer membrane immunogenic protein
MKDMKSSLKPIRWLALTILQLAILGSIAICVSAQNRLDERRTEMAKSLPLTETVPAETTTAPEPPAPLPPPPGKWTGWYIGGHLGYGWGRANTSFTPLPSAAQFINLAPTTLRPDPRGIVGGGQIGYNYQKAPIVYGVEFSMSASNMNGTVTQTPIIQNNGSTFNGNLTAHQDTDWFGTLRWRFGVLPTPNRRLMLYFTGGYAFGRVNYSANSDFRPQGTTQYPASFSKTKNGYTVGGGIEVAVSSNVSLKGEYLYYNLGNQSFTANPTPALPPFQVAYTWQTRAQTLTAGVNFHF